MTLEAIAAITVFLTVIGLIISNKTAPMTTALAGTLVLLIIGVLTLPQAAGHIIKASPTLLLFFGVMVVVQFLEKTGLFSWLASVLLLIACGEGKYLLLAVVLLGTMLSAFLPNATVVLLLAPSIIILTSCLKLESAPFLLLLVFAANTGGLLSLVGDPATYIVGQAAGLSFFKYFLDFTPVGGIALLALLLVLPWKWRELWNCQLIKCDAVRLPSFQSNRKMLLILFLIGVCFLVLIFLNYKAVWSFSPEVVALAGAIMALVFGELFQLSSVIETLAAIDWRTILFLVAMFVLSGALENTGVLEKIAVLLQRPVEMSPVLAKILLLWGMALLSAIIPNIPLLAAFTPILQTLALGQEGQILFTIMLLGATLGGNATPMGASANIVATGIANQAQQKISFATFFSYSLPVTFLELAAVTIWIVF